MSELIEWVINPLQLFIAFLVLKSMVHFFEIATLQIPNRIGSFVSFTMLLNALVKNGVSGLKLLLDFGWQGVFHNLLKHFRLLPHYILFISRTPTLLLFLKNGIFDSVKDGKQVLDMSIIQRVEVLYPAVSFLDFVVLQGSFKPVIQLRNLNLFFRRL